MSFVSQSGGESEGGFMREGQEVRLGRVERDLRDLRTAKGFESIRRTTAGEAMTEAEVRAKTGCRKAIAEDAAATGYVPRLLRDNGLEDEEWVALWDCAGVEAIDSSEGAFFQSEHDGKTWRAMVERWFGGS